MSQSENPDQQNLPQDFQQLSQHVQSEILESQKQIQLEKKMSISSIDDDVIDVATMPAFHTLQICLKEIQMNREVIIAMLLKSQEYLSKLYNIFENLEDFEENELLTIIYEIIRNLTVIQLSLKSYQMTIISIQPQGLFNMIQTIFSVKISDLYQKIQIFVLKDLLTILILMTPLKKIIEFNFQEIAQLLTKLTSN